MIFSKHNLQLATKLQWILFHFYLIFVCCRTHAYPKWKKDIFHSLARAQKQIFSFDISFFQEIKSFEWFENGRMGKWKKMYDFFKWKVYLQKSHLNNCIWNIMITQNLVVFMHRIIVSFVLHFYRWHRLLLFSLFNCLSPFIFAFHWHFKLKLMYDGTFRIHWMSENTRINELRNGVTKPKNK